MRSDIAGMQFGELVALEFVERRGKCHDYWNWKCSCGAEKVIRKTSVTSGNTESCGCKNRKRASKQLTKHGWYGTRTYKTWVSMIQRCENPNKDNYDLYGGRGISVCKRWRESFDNFLADMGERPKGTTIDRIDHNGNYEIANCRWASSKAQCRNRRSNRHLTHNGKTRCLAEWVEITGIDGATIDSRLKRGWSIKQALETKPIKAGKTLANV